MKTLKKVFALMLALSMVLALVATSFAEDVQEGNTDGTITIKSSAAGETYKVYKVFDLTYSFPEGISVDTGTNDSDKPVDIEKGDINVTYTFELDSATNQDLYDALTDDSPFVLTPTGTMEEDEDGVYNVTLADEDTTGEEIGNWFKDHESLLGTPVTKDGTGSDLVFDGLHYGYYYITTTQGTLVTVNSTFKDVTVVDKTVEPGIDKFVYEMDSFDENGKVPTATSGPAVAYYLSDEGWGKENDASFEDVVYFTDVVTVNKGALKYKVTDIMEKGLLYQNDAKVTAVMGPVGTTEGAVELTLNKDYTHNTTEGGFIIEFLTGDETFLYDNFYDDQEANVEDPTAQIYITYTAVVQDIAVINGEGNKNTVTLEWGNAQEVAEPVETTTYVHDLDVFKFFEDEEAKKHALADADFALFVDAACTIPVKLAEGTTSAGFGTTTGAAYKFSNAGTIDGSDNTHYITTNPTGYFKIYGLDSGTYYLKEMDAPAGYNLLEDPITITVGSTTSLTEVENETGVELPSTGGLGTTLLITFGSIIFMATMVLLVAKKRQYNEE